MCKVIAIANQKGGVAKTTTTINLGTGLVKSGKKVVLVDADPQGHLTMGLGFPKNFKVTLKSMMENIIMGLEFDPKEAILHHEEGVDLIPSNKLLAGMDMSLFTAEDREKVLKEYLDLLKDEYDYILIDCMPSLGMLTINALSAADSVLIPVQPQYYAADGLMELLKVVKGIHQRFNPDLQIEGILYLRDAIDTVASQATSQEEFSRLLSDRYNITFKVSRGRYSYLHPNRQKYITGRNLGTLYEENHLLQVFQENSSRQNAEKSHSTDRPVRDFSEKSNSSASVQTDETTHSFLFIKSDLRLVTDLQHCIKAQQSQAYAQKVKLSNLKMMAQTVAYVQEHGFQSKEDLDTALSNASAQSTDARNTLKSTDDSLKSINKQIHYTGQYLANKSIYFDYRKSRNKEKFYEDHRAELTLYESALRILKEKAQGKKLPTLKMLREEKSRLTELQTVQRDDFNSRREYERELRTVCSNVDLILNHPHIQESLHETSQEHSCFR